MSRDKYGNIIIPESNYLKIQPNNQNSNFGLGTINLDGYTFPNATTNSNSNSTVDQIKNWGFVPESSAMQKASSGITSDVLGQKYMDYLTGANAIKLSDVHSLSDFGSWLTDNRGGGSNYLSQGLGALGVGVNAWSAYNQNKYQNKLLDLQEGAQKFYEDQVNRQNQKQDTAQANYNAAQAR